MTTAKLFENGRSQAVRLPKEYRFEGEEVMITKIDEMVILVPKDSEWAGLMIANKFISDDFMIDGRAEDIPQERESL